MSLAFCSILALLETPALLRLVDYRSVFHVRMVEQTERPENLIDPELIYIRKPHLEMAGNQKGNFAMSKCLPGPSYAFRVRYDQKGFRNDSDLTTAEVAIIGDSFIEEPVIASPELVTSVVARLQNATVVNLGVSGYGPQQELAVLRRYALPLHPKVVVWAFFEGNDLDDLLRYPNQRSLVPSSANPSRTFVLRSFSRNALLAALQLMKRCKPDSVAQSSTGSIKDPNGKNVRIYYDYPGEPFSRRHENALAQLKTLFAEAFALCKAQGVRLIVAFVPTKFRVYSQIATFDPDSDIVNWEVNDLPRRLGATLAEISSEITYVDLTPALRAGAREGLVYFSDDTHWTPAGHKIAAEAISERISK